MPDALIISESPVPATTSADDSSVSSVFAALKAIRELLNANEDETQEESLGMTFDEVQSRFVAEPIRSLADALLKLEFVVGEEALDAIDENIIKGVIAYLRGALGITGQVQ